LLKSIVPLNVTLSGAAATGCNGIRKSVAASRATVLGTAALIGSALAITSKDNHVLKQWVGHVPLFSTGNAMEMQEKRQFLISRIGLAAHPHGHVL